MLRPEARLTTIRCLKGVEDRLWDLVSFPVRILPLKSFDIIACAQRKLLRGHGGHYRMNECHAAAGQAKVKVEVNEAVRQLLNVVKGGRIDFSKP